MKYQLALAALCTTSLFFGQVSCPNPFDSNTNGTVDIEDFLAVLSLFSDVDSDSDGVWDSQDDCLDSAACNFMMNPTEPCAMIDALGVCGGGCQGDGDGDGICDDLDNCVGELDECGVCNGPGPSEVIIESITIVYDSVFLPLENDWYVFPVSADTTFGYSCAPPCGELWSYQGYDYETVWIGEQCWFAENLRCENYANGEEIEANLSFSDWGSTDGGAVAVYGQEASCFGYAPGIDACDPAEALEEYGRIYNWHAVNDHRGLCPVGWHVSTDEEWTTMVALLGGEDVAGSKLKQTFGWYNDGTGTNTSGFSGLPAGFLDAVDGQVKSAGLNGYWWTSSPISGNAWYRYLFYSADNVFRFFNDPNNGYSIRCVRDAE